MAAGTPLSFAAAATGANKAVWIHGTTPVYTDFPMEGGDSTYSHPSASSADIGGWNVVFSNTNTGEEVTSTTCVVTVTGAAGLSVEGASAKRERKAKPEMEI